MYDKYDNEIKKKRTERVNQVLYRTFQISGTGCSNQWRRKMPKSGGAQRHVIYLPSVKNQYKRAVFGYMVI